MKHELPRYIMEHCNGKWDVYDTVECTTLTHDFKWEAEETLKWLQGGK